MDPFRKFQNTIFTELVTLLAENNILIQEEEARG